MTNRRILRWLTLVLLAVVVAIALIALASCHRAPTAPTDTQGTASAWFAATFALKSMNERELPIVVGDYTLDSGRIKTTTGGLYTDAILFHLTAESSRPLIDSIYGVYYVKPDSLIFSAPAFGAFRYAAAYDGTTVVVKWGGYPFVYRRAQ